MRIFSILLLFLLIYSCKNDKVSLDKNISISNLQTTDSLVVAQLIHRSNSFYKDLSNEAEILDGFLTEALELSIRNGLVLQEINIYNTIGKRYRNKAKYGDALRFHYKALDLAQNINSLELLAETYNQLGVVYRRTDDNAVALEMHFKALKYSEELKDTFNIGVAINSIGNVNYNLGRYYSSIEYFNRSYEIAKKGGNTLGLAINTNNIGESYLKMQMPDSALKYHNKSLQHNLQIGSKLGESICYNSIGFAYIAKGNLNRALGYLKQSLTINEMLGDPMHIAVSLSRVGEVYLSMNELNEAFNYINRSFELSKDIGSRFQAEESARQLSRFYEAQKKYETAMEYYKIATAYKDTILNEKSNYHLDTYEVLFETEQQKEKISQLNQQTLKQRYIMQRQKMFNVIFGLLATIAVVVAFMLRKQHKLKIQYQNLKNQHKLLRTQMNPHFIFNALSAIQVYVLEHDLNKSTKFLTDFAKLMRQVLKLSQQDYISLKDEKEILTHYLDLQQLRFNTPFHYEIDISKVSSPSTTLIPPMLTQPFIENAVEHGIKTIQDEGIIKIIFKETDNQLEVSIEDNGIGITASKQQKSDKTHESMAIRITKERLEVIQKDSGKKSKLEIIDKNSLNPFDRGTIVKIAFHKVSNG